MMNDALGNPILPNKEYGFFGTSNGFNTLTFGVLKKFNEKSVTLHVTRRAASVHYNIPTDVTVGKNTVVTNVKPFSLFPIHE